MMRSFVCMFVLDDFLVVFCVRTNTMQPLDKRFPAIKKNVNRDKWTDALGWSRELRFLRTMQRLSTKKAGRYPVRERVGPTKNPIPRRQRNAQQKETQFSCWYFVFGIKRIFRKLGRFTRSFDEIRVEMSSEPDSFRSGKRFQNTIYTLFRENQAVFRLFSEKL